uniref:Platelet-derived growth factor (PDGF) family profile domain-containing protein n=1 Tax=Glossina austeni TaxID=7395 RepID=A0A1A9VXY6_GLOAU
MFSYNFNENFKVLSSNGKPSLTSRHVYPIASGIFSTKSLPLCKPTKKPYSPRYCRSYLRQTEKLCKDDSDNIYSRYYVPGSVTRAKQEELGSPSAVLESRRAHAIKQRQHKALASAHHRRIVGEAICRLPQPRVERIRRDPWKIYTPHCTVLHRCADDTGCCPSERQTCAPKRTKTVDLYFFKSRYDKRLNGLNCLCENLISSYGISKQLKLNN